jgi:hypothetical protein
MAGHNCWPMPMRWKIWHDKRLVTVTADGPVTLRDIEAYFDAVVVADAQPYAKLLDATGMVAQLSDDDVMAIGARMSAYVRDQGQPGGPAAFVVTTSAARDFIERYLNLTPSSRRAMIFETVDEARHWLDLQMRSG